ncbi:MAG: winged helix DNA-binding domain-containing protein [Acidimicrobiia bacterium]|nr:winged helix DNA-binding domain-containing protein [Acidimicrobiia bacterium]
MRTLSADQARAHAIRSHFLNSPAPAITTVAEQLVGLHNTNQATPYLSVNARMEGFQRPDLDELMWERWDLARFRAMRLTMFVFPRALLEVAAAATRHIVEPYAARWLRDSGMTQRQFDRHAAAILEALEDGPLTSRQLRQRLQPPQEVELPSIVGRLCEQGHIVGGAPPGSWRSGVRRFHLWQQVLSDVDIHRWSEEAAIAELVSQYVTGYGPVTLADIAWWTGITKARCHQALESLSESLTMVEVEGWPGPLYLDRHAADPAVEPLSVSVLPLLDPYVQGYRDRQRLLPEERHDYVWDGGGNAVPTIVSGGQIIGVWQPHAKAVRYHLFDPARSDQDEIEAGLQEVGRLYFDEAVDVQEVPKMRSLREPGKARSAAHPLDETLHRAGRRFD